MRKLIVLLALVGFATTAFAQKKVMNSADRNFKRGNFEEALLEVNAALQHPETKDQPETLLLLGKIQTKMFDSDSAYDQSAVEKGREAFQTFNNTMEMVGNDKESSIGKEVYKEDMAGIPENLKPYTMFSLKMASFNKAIQNYEEDDYEMAYEFFALSADIDHQDTTVNFNAGYLANDLGKTEEAKTYFMRLLEVDEYDKLTAYYLLIQLANTEKDQEEAYRWVTEAKKQYPDDKALNEFEIQLLLHLNKMDEALESIKQALAEEPNDAGNLLRYGYLKEQSGDIDGALEEYIKAVKADPDFFEAQYYTGAIYLDRARAILAEVNNLSDVEWEKRSESMTKEANDLYLESVPYFTKASEIQPENTEIMEILFQIHTRLKNSAEAEKFNQKLIAILGENWMNR